LGGVSADGVAQALENLCGNSQHCRHLAQGAFEAAQNPEYSWGAIAERFDEAFAGLA
jgi:glycosyltransferase involved in cell wall biosynthesis